MARCRRRSTTVDDVAVLTVLDHVGHEDVEAVDHAEDVDLEGPPPVVRGVEPQLRLGRWATPGVVAQDVDVAEPLSGGVGQRLHRRDVGDVGAHAMASAPPATSASVASASAPGSMSASTTRMPSARTARPWPGRCRWQRR
jgi:hypothetical protein